MELFAVDHTLEAGLDGDAAGTPQATPRGRDASDAQPDTAARRHGGCMQLTLHAETAHISTESQQLFIVARLAARRSPPAAPRAAAAGSPNAGEGRGASSGHDALQGLDLDGDSQRAAPPDVSLEQCGLGWRLRSSVRRRKLDSLAAQRISVLVELAPAASAAGAQPSSGGAEEPTAGPGRIERIFTPLAHELSLLTSPQPHSLSPPAAAAAAAGCSLAAEAWLDDCCHGEVVLLPIALALDAAAAAGPADDPASACPEAVCVQVTASYFDTRAVAPRKCVATLVLQRLSAAELGAADARRAAAVAVGGAEAERWRESTSVVRAERARVLADEALSAAAADADRGATVAAHATVARALRALGSLSELRALAQTRARGSAVLARICALQAASRDLALAGGLAREAAEGGALHGKGPRAPLALPPALALGGGGGGGGAGDWLGGSGSSGGIAVAPHLPAGQHAPHAAAPTGASASTQGLPGAAVLTRLGAPGSSGCAGGSRTRSLARHHSAPAHAHAPSPSAAGAGCGAQQQPLQQPQHQQGQWLSCTGSAFGCTAASAAAAAAAAACVPCAAAAQPQPQLGAQLAAAGAGGGPGRALELRVALKPRTLALPACASTGCAPPSFASAFAVHALAPRSGGGNGRGGGGGAASGVASGGVGRQCGGSASAAKLAAGGSLPSGLLGAASAQSLGSAPADCAAALGCGWAAAGGSASDGEGAPPPPPQSQPHGLVCDGAHRVSLDGASAAAGRLGDGGGGGGGGGGGERSPSSAERGPTGSTGGAAAGSGAPLSFGEPPGLRGLGAGGSTTSAGVGFWLSHAAARGAGGAAEADGAPLGGAEGAPFGTAVGACSHASDAPALSLEHSHPLPSQQQQQQQQPPPPPPLMVGCARQGRPWCHARGGGAALLEAAAATVPSHSPAPSGCALAAAAAASCAHGVGWNAIPTSANGGAALAASGSAALPPAHLAQQLCSRLRAHGGALGGAAAAQLGWQLCGFEGAPRPALGAGGSLAHALGGAALAPGAKQAASGGGSGGSLRLGRGRARAQPHQPPHHLSPLAHGGSHAADGGHCGAPAAAAPGGALSLSPLVCAPAYLNALPLALPSSSCASLAAAAAAAAAAAPASASCVEAWLCRLLRRPRLLVPLPEDVIWRILSFVPPAVAFHASLRSPTLVVDKAAIAPGSFATVSAALRAASHGDVILLKPGVYRESLCLETCVALIALGAGTGAAGGGGAPGPAAGAPVLLMSARSHTVQSSAPLAQLVGLTLRQTGACGRSCALTARGVLELLRCEISSASGLCVEVTGSAAPLIRACRVHDGAAAGIWFRAGGGGVVEGCEIARNGWSGVQISEGAHPLLLRNAIFGNKSAGLISFNGGRGCAAHNEISRNGKGGVQVRSGASPVLRCNEIHDEKSFGIWVYEKGLGSFEHNHVHDNAWSGFQVEEGSAPTVTSNRVYNNQSAGIVVYNRGAGLFAHNEVFANGRCGVQIKSGSSPVFRHNRIHHEKQAGVLTAEDGSGLIEDNEIHDCAWSGVQTEGPSDPLLRRNLIHHNGGAGFIAYQNGSGVLENNVIYANRKYGVQSKTGGHPVVRANAIHDKAFAIYLTEHGAGLFEGNSLHAIGGGRTGSGIYAAADCSPVLNGNSDIE